MLQFVEPLKLLSCSKKIKRETLYRHACIKGFLNYPTTQLTISQKFKSQWAA